MRWRLDAPAMQFFTDLGIRMAKGSEGSFSMDQFVLEVLLDLSVVTCCWIIVWKPMYPDGADGLQPL
jgi:hypothetical protein